jgi:putative phosphoesterase
MKFRIGVISDTHLRAVTNTFMEIWDQYLCDKDVIVHAGDIVSTDIIEFLSRKDFHGVHGNMDPVEVKALLPRKKVIELGPYRLGLIHGWGASASLEDGILEEFENVDIIVYGHTHHAASHNREGVLLFNPGTATGFASSGIHSIGILELDHIIRGEIIRLAGEL